MKKLWATGIFVTMCFLANAQFSLSAKYGLNSYPEWEALIEGTSVSEDLLIGDGIEYGFSYWFRLKNYRVEFMPEVSYQKLATPTSLYQMFTQESFFLTFNSMVYTLDIEGDCNCPTWGKDGSFIEKGFFVGVNPGIGYHKFAYSTDVLEAQSNKIAFRIGVSTGLDIGITKWITITPYATVNYTPALTWEGLEPALVGTKPGDISTQIWQIMPGLRMTFRPDYLKEQRGMFR